MTSDFVSRIPRDILLDVPPMPRALIGAGLFGQLGIEAREMGFRRVMVVSTGLRGTEIVDEALSLLRQSGVEPVLYQGVESNPKDTQVMEIYAAFTSERCDGYVSIGGGSAHDATKGARFVGAHDGRSINEFRESQPQRVPTPPHIAINTTAGTGAETTRMAVITDTTSDDAPIKWALRSHAIVPALAINDPLLYLSVPTDLKAYCGFDVLAHASETCFSPHANPHSRSLGGEAIRLLATNLRESVSNPRNFVAHERMMWAQYLAAMAFMSGKLGIVHGISHAISAFYDTHHGLNCGIIMPRAWADASKADPTTMRQIAIWMGEDVSGLSAFAAADRAVDASIRLLRDLDSPENLISVKPYSKTRMGEGIYAKIGGKQITGDQKDIDRIVKHVVEIGPHEYSAHAMNEERIRDMVTSTVRGTL